MSSNDISTCLFNGSILRGRANAEDPSLNRKDRHARKRDAEKFRLQKNQVFDCRRQVELQKNFGQSSSLETMSRHAIRRAQANDSQALCFIYNIYEIH